MLIDVLFWVTGLRTAGVHIPHPILDLATFVSVSLEASAGAVNPVPSGPQPLQAPTSAIVCAIVRGSDLSQSAAAAPGWFDSSVNVGSASSSDVSSASCLSFVLPQVVSEVALS